MPSKLIPEAFEKLTRYGYTLKVLDRHSVSVTTPRGFTSTISLKRLPSYARYVR